MTHAEHGREFVNGAVHVPGPVNARATPWGHPRGLAYLAFTEAWERFSFAGMQSLLVLYMVDQLLQPGHVERVAGFEGLRAMLEGVYGPLAPQPLSSAVYGLYSGLAFLAPVFGGVLADRWFGQHRMVLIGALLMCAGHLLMAFEPSFLLALGLLIVGCGCLKGNITTQVGSLYADGDRRRTDAFQLFSIGMNTGIIAAPLVCGTLGELYGWHYGFGAAGIGMLIGLGIYLTGMRHLPADRRGPQADTAATQSAVAVPAATAGVASPPMDRRLLLVLAVVFVLATCFVVTAGQLGNTYNLWLRSDVDRGVPWGATVPVTWFQSLTPLVTVLVTPAALRLWQRQAERGREAALLGKMGQGLAMAALAMLLLAGLASLSAGGQPVSWLAVLPVHALVALGYVFVYPVGLALFSRVAPPGMRSMFIGIYFTTSFVASNLVGWIGGLYATLPGAGFWLLQAAIGASGAMLVLLLGRPLGRIAATAPSH